MEIKQSGSQPSGKGPAEWFTGSVRIDPLFPAVDPSRVSAALVTFEPGSRTAWHTSGKGWSSLPAAVGCSARVARSVKFEPATWSCVRPARSTGTGRLQRPV